MQKSHITENHDCESGLSRRSFLKAGVAATALTAVPKYVAAEQAQRALPAIPTVRDLAADQFTHVLRDLYALPTAQNEYGYVQMAKSVTGFTSLSLPPYV